MLVQIIFFDEIHYRFFLGLFVLCQYYYAKFHSYVYHKRNFQTQHFGIHFQNILVICQDRGIIFES